MPFKAPLPKRGTAAIAAAAVVAAGVALALWWPRGGDAPPAAAMAAAPQPARMLPPPGAALPAVDERSAQLHQLKEQAQLTDHTYCSYVASTKYPVSSRPMSEQPDQVYPNAPVAEQHALREEGGRKTDESVLVQTSQSRVYMAAGEAVAFSIRAVDKAGLTLPLVVTRALAVGIAGPGGRAGAPVALAFGDDGKGADPVAGDGAFAGVLAPAASSLATFNGTIRTELRYSVNGKNGVVLFDVIYSPELPATWSGPAREVVENGSLVYYLKAEVRQAGRYIVTGRVDDARGKPFALATFNDLLRQGPNEVKLTVFGKLLRDEAPAMPLTLRDVDGYLLKEDTDPDRALMPRLEGRVLAGKAHPLKGFSDAEWQGEERTRYLAELGKDRAAAAAALRQADPSAAVARACP